MPSCNASLPTRSELLSSTGGMFVPFDDPCHTHSRTNAASQIAMTDRPEEAGK